MELALFFSGHVIYSNCLTNSAQKWLSDVFNVIVFVQHANVMLQLCLSAAPGRQTHTHTDGSSPKAIFCRSTFMSQSRTHSASSWAISASSWFLLLRSSASSSAGLAAAPSVTCSYQVQTKSAQPSRGTLVVRCVFASPYILTGDLKFDWTFLNLENGVLVSQNRRFLRIVSWSWTTRTEPRGHTKQGTQFRKEICACFFLKKKHKHF